MSLRRTFGLIAISFSLTSMALALSANFQAIQAHVRIEAVAASRGQ